MQSSSPVVRQALRSDVGTVARVLAEAFDADPMMRSIVSAKRYRKRLTSLFAFETLLSPRGSWVAVVDGEIAGAALWGLPGVPPPGFWATLRHSRHLLRAFGTGLPRALRSFRVIEDAHPTSPPHWYLQTLGVARPGRGVGGALLRDGLARADAQGMPAYLESSTPANIPIYERYGFRPTREIVLPDGPTLTAMWRDPVRGGQ
ncbi:GNAT family N-acetyltransferase [Jiangella anatolica]|uniref:GNAT family N-acetyltransferase n=1 Tax=Jiangella anatolica TaxID=2670374 RepID=A0A2W2B9V2_9ACTN|nr:GNAT family N-acetyltransferase [Jiangella anatolica]PZF81970.1 GNAT family N-acetyltransferase [Jiangella anatolica]